MGRAGWILLLVVIGFLIGRLTEPASREVIRTVNVPTECPAAVPPVDCKPVINSLHMCINQYRDFYKAYIHIQDKNTDLTRDVIELKTEAEYWRQRFRDYECPVITCN